MQLDAMRLFCAIVEAGSITGGAARMHITQSAASQQVKALERRLNQQLLERGALGVRPTAPGDAAYQTFRDILDRFEAMERQLQEIGRVVAGAVRVATVYSVGLHDLPPYIKRFLQLHPSCRIHLEYDHADRIYEMVARGLFDIGMVAYPRENRRLGVIPLPGDHLTAIASPRHPLSRSSTIYPSDLSGQKMIAFARGIPTRRALDRLLTHYQVDMEVIMELDNVETIKRSVEAELGISIIPRRCAGREVESGTLVAIPVAAVGFWRPVGIVYRRGRPFSSALRSFITLLTDQEFPNPDRAGA